jgi:cytochrome c oxidase subunit 4
MSNETAHADAHAADGHHEFTTKNYIVVALILGAITGLEVAISYVDIGAVFIPLLLILMAIKFFTVVLYFMHLKFDNRLFSLLFYMGLGLAPAVYITAMLTMHYFG